MEPDFDLKTPSIAYRAGEFVEHLTDCGVALVEWPDGDNWLVKGADRLRGIVATGEAELMRIGLISVANTAQAEIVAAAWSCPGRHSRTR